MTVYSLVDQPHGRLPRGSHFLLWAMRYWVRSRRHGCSPFLGMEESFQAMGLQTILPAFNGVMRAIHEKACCPMDFGDLDHPTITASEAVMLTLWADIGEPLMDRAERVLPLLVGDESAAGVGRQARQIVDLMARIGIAPARSLEPDTSNADRRGG